MKIAYLIIGTFNSGGMERVLANKANFLAEKKDYDISIITSDQKGQLPFFCFSEKIKHFDLAINYTNDSKKSFFIKTFSHLLRIIRHCKALKNILEKEHFDIVISMFGPELYFLPFINKRSKKLVEIHFSKYFRYQKERRGLWRLSDELRSYLDERIILKYDKFIVLSEEDRSYWKKHDNIGVIYNSNINNTQLQSSRNEKKVIAVGRLTHQKGFDNLICAWEIVAAKHSDWKLSIYGDGEDRELLKKSLKEKGLGCNVYLCDPVSDIKQKYLESSIFVLSSRYEGLPMVLIEAMSYGLPPVAFACKCGPKDIIDHSVNGILVEEGDNHKLADAICCLIENIKLREMLGEEAFTTAHSKFEENTIMEQWVTLFEDMLNGV